MRDKIEEYINNEAYLKYGIYGRENEIHISIGQLLSAIHRFFADRSNKLFMPRNRLIMLIQLSIDREDPQSIDALTIDAYIQALELYLFRSEVYSFNRTGYAYHPLLSKVLRTIIKVSMVMSFIYLILIIVHYI